MISTKHKSRVVTGALLGSAVLARTYCANFLEPEAVAGPVIGPATAGFQADSWDCSQQRAAFGAAKSITAKQLKDYLDFIASDELEGRAVAGRRGQASADRSPAAAWSWTGFSTSRP